MVGKPQVVVRTEHQDLAAPQADLARLAAPAAVLATGPGGDQQMLAEGQLLGNEDVTTDGESWVEGERSPTNLSLSLPAPADPAA